MRRFRSILEQMRPFLRLAVALPLVASAALAEPPAKIDCAISENGRPASGWFKALQGDQEVTKGACGKPVDVPAGDYEVVVSLDGALDAPSQREKTAARAGQTAMVRVRFETGELLVEVMRAEKRSLGTVRLLKGEGTVATFSAGVANRLSAGTYAVEVESRGQKRRFDGVTIVAGERRTIAVDFGK